MHRRQLLSDGSVGFVREAIQRWEARDWGWTYGALVGGFGDIVSSECFAVCIRRMQERKDGEVEELCCRPHGGDLEVFW
jgi:hypothetical protein